MAMILRDRRGFLSTLGVTLILQPQGLLAQSPPVEFFEDLRWYERKPGSTEPRILKGKLAVNRPEEKIAFFSGYTNRFESPFNKVKGLTYEYAQRPSDLTVPVAEWHKAFGRSKKHFLTFKYQDKEGYFKEELLELEKKTYNELLTALEYATGLETKRL